MPVRSRTAVAAVAFLLLVGVAGPSASDDPPSFPDVPPSNPFFDDITWMATEGVATGYDDGNYRPQLPVSRQAMAGFMHRLSDVLGGPTETSPADFPDVPPSNPFHDDIDWMNHHGVTEGFPDGTFGPVLPVSRQAMAGYMHRLSDVLGGPTETSPVDFPDVPPSNPFHDDINWMAHHGITLGTPSGTYEPTAPVSRQAMAGFMHRLADLLGGSDSVCLTQTQIPLLECRALQAMYERTDGPDWVDDTDWLITPAPCSWRGVTCAPAPGGSPDPAPLRVVSLSLPENGLDGPLPSELRHLRQLGHLDLFGNRLRGPLPPDLGTLSELYLLDLDHNEISGAIPPEMGALNHLSELHLGANELSGPIPAEVAAMDNLSVFSLYDNQLSGPIPASFDALGLTHIDLDGNALTGTIPAGLGTLSQLRTMSLDHNELTGSVPAALGDAAELRWLSLDHNQLSGAVPAALMDLTHITTLRLHQNGCLTASDPALTTWLAGLDPEWNDGCPS